MRRRRRCGKVATHEGGWRNSKHALQWSMTLTRYCGPIRSKPADEITTADVLSVLQPVWTRAPETASRLRGRIESVIDAARALGHIPEDRANCARWKGHLDKLLPKRQRLTRGHHRALAYADVPALLARLSEIDSVAARALQFTVLTAARTGETLGAKWNEIDLDKAVWTIPASRMKMGKPHRVPLSDPALALLHAHAAELGDSEKPFVFPGRPMRSLSNMSMVVLGLGRLGVSPHRVVPLEAASRCARRSDAERSCGARRGSWARLASVSDRKPVERNAPRARIDVRRGRRVEPPAELHFVHLDVADEPGRDEIDWGRSFLARR